MIEATHVPQPERERPDRFAVSHIDGKTAVVLDAMPSILLPDRVLFRLPGTRRAKAVEELMGALKEWHRLRHAHTEIGYVDAIDRLEAAYSALLALDAKNEQEPRP